MDLLKDYPVVIEFPIAWGDMDSFQHVNNVLYFRYFENARMAYFEKLKAVALMKKTGIGPILASTHCKFKMPLTYPDTITVGAKVVDLEEDRFTMKYIIVSNRVQKVAAEGEGLIIYYCYNENKKAPIPIETKELILKYENA